MSVSGPRNIAAAAYVNDLQKNVDNAKNYGVVGDGIVDDTAALQKAINNSKVLLLPAGRYRITDTLVIGANKDGFEMYGQGKGNNVSAVAVTIFYWDGAADGTMIQVYSNANVFLHDFTLYGRNISFTATNPGKGLEVTALNADGSSHFSNFQRIDCSYIDGNPGCGFYVGSLTDDDISNHFFRGSNFTFCKECIRQVGSQTINNFYHDNIFLEYTDKGVNYVKGNAHLRDNGFYGGPAAKEDVLVSDDVLEFEAQGNYHEVINNRTGSSAYSFPSGTTRIEPTLINGSRIITIVADTPNMVDYQQAGPLSVTNCIIGSLDSGNAIFADNQRADPPQPLSLQGTTTLDPVNWPTVVKGNWNFSQSVFRQLRSYFVVTALADVATAQDIFDDDFILQDETAYNVEISIQIVKTAGTNAHTINMLYAGTANVVLTEINYVVRQKETDFNLPQAALMSSHSSATAATLTNSSATASELISIIGRGQIRTADAGAGTWIPQLQYSAAPGGVPSIRPNSFIMIEPVGDIGIVNLNPF